MELVDVPIATTGGGFPRVPVAYGQYEVGRSSRPGNKEAKQPNPWSVDGMPQAVPLEPQGTVIGDPGAYHPYEYEDAGTNPLHNSSSKNRKPFDSTQVRELRATLFGLETPSVGAYPVFQPEKTIGQLDDAVRYPLQDANVRIAKGMRPSPHQICPALTSSLPPPMPPDATSNSAGLVSTLCLLPLSFPLRCDALRCLYR